MAGATWSTAVARQHAGEWIEPPGNSHLMSLLHFDCAFAYPGGFQLQTAFTAGLGVTALVGPSGSGKTTVLNLIAGLLTPSRGTIVLKDLVLFDAAKSINAPPNRRGVGYVFQDYQLFPHLSVEQNLRYGMARTERTGPPLQAV